MRYLLPNDEGYNEIITFFKLLNPEESKGKRIPVFKERGMKLIPLNSSCLHPNGKIYDLIEELQGIDNLLEFYILPIDHEMELIKTTKSYGFNIQGSQKKCHFNSSECGFLEVNRTDKIDSIIELLNNDNCFIVFESFLIIDRSQKWCLFDAGYLPFTLFFCKADLFKIYKGGLENRSDIGVAKDEFEKEMVRLGVGKEYKALAELYDIYTH